MFKVCVVTGTRAEFGLLKPVIQKIEGNPNTELQLVVTGTHLCLEFGYTVSEIIEDGFLAFERIECVSEADTDIGMTKSAALAMDRFADYFNNNRPDILLVLGDRYEIFACAAAAAIAKIPIAHMYGGDTTQGAVDELFRHSITKMSYLHFTSNEQSRKRVIQLGEEPDRVYNVGATGIENILKMEYLLKDELEKELGFSLDKPYAVVTFHPVTMETGDPKAQISELLFAIDTFDDMNFIITKANADANGREINQVIDKFVRGRDNVISFDSLGMKRYLSALKYAIMIIGNSSSGIYEAPALGIPTVNIGDRQKGRVQASTVLNCEPERQKIAESIKRIINMKVEDFSDCGNNPYYREGTSEKIAAIINETLMKGKIDLKKKFYDVEIKV